MSTIFAIGGGDIRRGETREIDRRIIDAAPTNDPRILFIPTASGDATGYIEAFEAYFWHALNCSTDALTLVDKSQIDAESAEKIGAADVIYVGGGDTAYMLEIWRTRGIDDLLREAWEGGTIMTGISAGAICWFAGGLGDAVAVQDIEFGPVDGLGFVSGLHMTPHANSERRAAFTKYLSLRGATGVALEDQVAMELSGDDWRIHKSTANANAYHISPGDDTDAVEVLPSDDTYRPISNLI